MILARARLGPGPRLVSDLREVWLGEPAAVTAVLREAVPVGSGTNVVVLLRPRHRSVLRATPDQAGQITNAATVRQLILSRFGPAGEQAGWAWCAAATGGLPVPGQPWLLDVLLAPGGAEVAEQLGHWGITPLRRQSARLSLIGALANTAKVMPTEAPLLLCDISETRTDLFVVTGGGVEGLATVAAGLGTVVDALQAALQLRLRGTGVRLLFGQGYDFTELAQKIFQPLANQLKPAVTGLRKRPVRLVCSGLGGGQDWAVTALGEALGVPAWSLNLAAWATARGLAFADAVRADQISPAWLGLLGAVAAFDADNPASNLPWHACFNDAPLAGATTPPGGTGRPWA